MSDEARYLAAMERVRRLEKEFSEETSTSGENALASDLRILLASANKPSCATCKWAEALHETAYPVEQGFTLECLRDNAPEATFRANSPYSMFVKPIHGCVQWEGK